MRATRVLRTSSRLWLRPTPVRTPRRLVRPVLSSCCRRFESTSAPSSRPLTDSPDKVLEPAQAREEQPAYQMTFTCKACQHRSSHRISKQAYHHGTTLITCPGCKNRHLISDHLEIFSDKSITLEDILKQKGELLKKGALDGDIEFWDDGTQTTRGPSTGH